MALTEDTETLMKHYTILVDVLKFYLELVLKFITFSFAVTGAIVSYYLSQPNTGYMRYALILPFVVNLALAIFAFYASSFVGYLDKELDRIRDAVGFLDVIDATFLTKMLYLAGVLSTVVVILLVVLFLMRPVI
jgi:hypothetical protein